MTNVVYFGLPIENRTGKLVQMPIVKFNETEVTNKMDRDKFPQRLLTSELHMAFLIVSK